MYKAYVEIILRQPNSPQWYTVAGPGNLGSIT